MFLSWPNPGGKDAHFPVFMDEEDEGVFPDPAFWTSALPLTWL